MLLPVNGNTEGYLDDLDRIQSALNALQRQVSSGVRVGVASDDPAAVAPILKTQSAIGMDQQLQTNLSQVKTDLQNGDTALQQASKLLDQAISVAAQAASTVNGQIDSGTLLNQAVSIQQALVGLASTTVNGRYIFSGDRDKQPLYAFDPAQPNSVRQLAPAASTVVVTDRNGIEVWRPITASAIFDSGDAATGNVFAAVGGLIDALKTGNAQDAQAAVDNLKAASEHVNQQAGLYGIAENRVADATTSASQAVVSEKQDLSGKRDTDLAAAAVELNQIGNQQQAALSVGARVIQKSLFDYLA